MRPPVRAVVYHEGLLELCARSECCKHGDHDGRVLLFMLPFRTEADFHREQPRLTGWAAFSMRHMAYLEAAGDRSLLPAGTAIA
jgi:hypothetical protein